MKIQKNDTKKALKMNTFSLSNIIVRTFSYEHPNVVTHHVLIILSLISLFKAHYILVEAFPLLF